MTKKKKKDKFQEFLDIIPMNMISYTVVTSVIISTLDHFFKIPWNIENGASINYDMLLLFVPVIFVIVYTAFYVNKKVGGFYLIYK